MVDLGMTIYGLIDALLLREGHTRYMNIDQVNEIKWDGFINFKKQIVFFFWTSNLWADNPGSIKPRNPNEIRLVLIIASMVHVNRLLAYLFYVLSQLLQKPYELFELLHEFDCT